MYLSSQLGVGDTSPCYSFLAERMRKGMGRAGLPVQQGGQQPWGSLWPPGASEIITQTTGGRLSPAWVPPHSPVHGLGSALAAPVVPAPKLELSRLTLGHLTSSPSSLASQAHSLLGPLLGPLLTPGFIARSLQPPTNFSKRGFLTGSGFQPNNLTSQAASDSPCPRV